MGKSSLRLLNFEDHVGSLNRFDGAEQDLKDKIHARLNSRCEFDARTGCWVYTGCWSPNGQGVVRVGQKKYTVARVSAWLYIQGFHLEDSRCPYRRCECSACFNPEHIRLAKDRADGLCRLRLMGRWGQGRRKLNQQIADGVRIAYANTPDDRLEFVKQQSSSLGVTPQSVGRIIDDLSWVRRNGKQSADRRLPGVSRAA
jgi:hypothetical protein